MYLPLEEGDNELALAVSEKFGGWGFMVRDLAAIYRHPSLQVAWELADQLRAPESVAFDSDRQVLYVSNFGGDGISKIALDGTILAREWVTGLKAPTGLKLFGGKLYAVERSGVAVIDPGRGAIASRHPIPGAAFLNDLALDETGAIYVTDSFKDRVYRIAGETVETWIAGPAVKNPNGIAVEAGRVLVGTTGDSAIKAIDRQTRQVTTLLTLESGANMDGLVTDGSGGYLFSDYYGRVYRVTAGGHRTLLVDRRGPRQYTADFEFIPEKGLLIVPSLYDNRLTAYRLSNP